MRRSLVLLLAMVVSLPFGIGRLGRATAGGPTIVHVDDDAAPNGDGTAWNKAYKSLAKALAENPGPAEFWVAGGTYAPDWQAAGDRSASHVITAGQHLYAGFAGNETSRDQRDIQSNEVTLTGDIGQPGVEADNSYRVVDINLAVDEAATLDGFRIAFGYDDRVAGDAGGIVISDGDVALSNLDVEDNAGKSGGGIHVKGGNVSFTLGSSDDNRVLTAGTPEAGAVRVTGGSFTATQSAFVGTGTNVDGGALVAASGGDLTFDQVYIWGDEDTLTVTGADLVGGTHSFKSVFFINVLAGVDSVGGSVSVTHSIVFLARYGLKLDQGTATVENDTFSLLEHALTTNIPVTVNNSTFVAVGQGAGVTGTVVRNSIVAPEFPGIPDDIELPVTIAPGAPVSPAHYEDSILTVPCAGNITCSDIVSDDPQLKPAAGVGDALLPVFPFATTSPAIDAGNPATCAADDQAFRARPVDGDRDGTPVCDIGAYELDPPVLAATAVTPSGSEGDELQVTVRSSGDLLENATVDYALTPGTATRGADFKSAAGSLVVPPGGCGGIFGAPAPVFDVVPAPAPCVTGAANDFFVVSLKQDFRVEPDETFTVTLSNADDAFVGDPLTLTIVDDEPRVECDGKPATFVGTDQDDRIIGTDGPDVIVARDGDDRIRALAGEDVVCGGPGDDLVFGNRGEDRVFGGDGDDVLRGGAAGDALFGGRENDQLTGFVGADRLFGGMGTDHLQGEAGADRLAGGPEAGDSCDGGDGDDALLPDDGCESVVGVP